MFTGFVFIYEIKRSKRHLLGTIEKKILGAPIAKISPLSLGLNLISVLFIFPYFKIFILFYSESNNIPRQSSQDATNFTKNACENIIVNQK